MITARVPLPRGKEKALMALACGCVEVWQDDNNNTARIYNINNHPRVLQIVYWPGEGNAEDLGTAKTLTAARSTARYRLARRNAW